MKTTLGMDARRSPELNLDLFQPVLSAAETTLDETANSRL